MTGHAVSPEFAADIILEPKPANSQLRYGGKGNNRDVNMNGVRVIRHVIIRGRVQGVGFRAFVEHHARQRNLDGWVRNRGDGTVEAVFAGPDHSVEGMIGACKVGPLSSRVDAIDQREGTEADLAALVPGEKFSCRPTA
jgi:acylphosphatase